MKTKIELPAPLYFKGGKKAVLLLHAYSGTPNDVRLLARFLEKNDFTVYAPLFHGHGTLDPRDILKSGPEDWWADVEKSIAFLKKESFSTIAVFGLSMGGIFALRALECFSEAVLSGGAFCSPIFPEAKTNILPSFLTYSEKVLKLGGKNHQEIETELAELEPLLNEQLTQIKKFSQKVYTNLENIRQPVFLAQAGQDKMIEPDSVYKTQSALKNSAAELYWYAESGHVITVDKVHKELEQDILIFLEKMSWNEENE